MRRKDGHLRQLFFALLSLSVLFLQLMVAPIPAHGDDTSCLTAEASGCMYGLPTFQYQLLLGQMVAHPLPDVRSLEADLSELGVSRSFRVIGGTQPLYDAPGGAIIGVIDSGFAFVKVRARQGAWAQLGAKGWLPLRKLTLACGGQITRPPAFSHSSSPSVVMV